jgi:hypothetical protein
MQVESAEAVRRSETWGRGNCVPGALPVIPDISAWTFCTQPCSVLQEMVAYHASGFATFHVAHSMVSLIVLL